GGQAITQFLGADAYAQALAIDGFGRIVVVGCTAGKFMIVRFTPSGTQDASFHQNGIVLTEVGLAGCANAVAIDGAGRIVAVGAVSIKGFWGDQPATAIARFLP